MIYERMELELAKRKSNGLYRELKVESDLSCCPVLSHSSHSSHSSHFSDFSSNDYLGFAKNSRLKKIISEHLSADHFFENGSSGSRLLSGNSFQKEKVEKEIADFFKAEKALVFPSGLLANSALISTIAKEKDLILSDQDIHASFKWGAKSSKASRSFFRHNDLTHLEGKLLRNKKRFENIFVCVESVYSMDGSLSPLKNLLDLCSEYQAHLIVDEAHAVGVFGKEGEGRVTSVMNQTRWKESESPLLARVITFGKAFGGHGAAILSSSLMQNYLINFCLPFIYSTSPPDHFFLSLTSALNFFKENKKEKNKLWENCHYAQTFYEKKISSPIVPIFFKKFSIDSLNKIKKSLDEKNFSIPLILSPTVKKGEERLRLVLHSYNTKDEIKDFFIHCQSFLKGQLH